MLVYRVVALNISKKKSQENNTAPSFSSWIHDTCFSGKVFLKILQKGVETSKCIVSTFFFSNFFFAAKTSDIVAEELKH